MDKAAYRYLAEACREYDHEAFDLLTWAGYHKCSTVSDWAELLDSRVRVMNGVCGRDWEDPRNSKIYLQDTSSLNVWAEAEVIFNQSVGLARSDLQSAPSTLGQDLVRDLQIYSTRDSVLIAELLPELVELKKFDPGMKAVMRKKWTSIDSIMDVCFGKDRKDRCAVPSW